ncbi:hypothetical protein [Halorubellus sp. PRR65]|uniref:hypothetical protein n=1 Tax=Halorubellus sp. PRR65 TaxID=3098148 RepID=UPI002B257A31|nr:hypothetical protein [Halorubellus sp. PRR65]
MPGARQATPSVLELTELGCIRVDTSGETAKVFGDDRSFLGREVLANTDFGETPIVVTDVRRNVIGEVESVNVPLGHSTRSEQRHLGGVDFVLRRETKMSSLVY